MWCVEVLLCRAVRSLLVVRVRDAVAARRRRRAPGPHRPLLAGGALHGVGDFALVPRRSRRCQNGMSPRDARAAPTSAAQRRGDSRSEVGVLGGIFLHLPVDRQIPGDERVFFVAPNRVKFTWYRDICYHRANRVTPLLAVVAEGADFAPGGPASRVCRAPPPRRLWPVRSGVLWTLPSHAEPTSLGGL